LPAEARLTRFQATVSDESIRSHCQAIDWYRTVLVGCFVGDVLKGAAEVCFDRVLYPQEAEIAVTVAIDDQGNGLGTELVRRALTVARNRGADHAAMVCLPQNRRMQHIAHKLDVELGFSHGAVVGRFDLARATPLSRWTEALEDAGGLVHAWARSRVIPGIS
jgi:GNAT superfamily N-acetyltransferase